MGYVIKKRRQVDGFAEMPKDKRPPDIIVWWGTEDDIEDWIDKVYDNKEKPDDEISFIIPEEIIE